MPPRSNKRIAGQSGFTLIEVLAGLAIAAVIIMSTAALMWNVTIYFDHGTRNVSEADRLVLAVDRLAADFGAARFAQRVTASGGVAAAFIGQSGKVGQGSKVVFVSGAIVSTSPQTEELVVLTVEQAGEITRLVRRRAQWLGPRTHLEGIVGKDPVALLEGRIDIRFAFGKVTSDGALAWQDSWIDEFALPRFVRMSVRSRGTGAELLSGSQFVVRSNSPPSCVADDANATCLVAAADNGTNQPQPATATPPQGAVGNQIQGTASENR